MTLIGLFSGAKAATTPVGSAIAAEGGADFAALLGAVATPLLFAATPGTAPSPAAPVAPAPSEIQENGTAPAAAAPAIPGIPVGAVDQTPEFPKGEQGGAVLVAASAGATSPAADPAPAAPRAKKAADAEAPGAVATVAPAPTAATAPPASPAVVSAPALVTTTTPSSVPSASAPAADAATPIAAAAPVAATAASASSAGPAGATPVATVTVSGVEVELVVTSVADKPAAVKQRTQDASGSAAAGVLAPAGAGGAASAAPMVAAPASAPAPAPANAPTFSAQVAKPLFILAAGPAGEHVVTVNVTPDNLGPVTVRAHVGTEGMRVELFAPNDAGREAIRSILPDLRRDLAGQGVTADLDLSSQSQPFDRGGDTAARDRATAQNLPGRQDAAPRDGEQPSRRPHTSTSLLDVLA